MSAGHRDPAQRPPTPQEDHQLALLLADKKFQAALLSHPEFDNSHDVAFLAGSSKDGRTIYFDKDFVAAINNGEIAMDGKSFDPRPFLAVHESVENSILRGQYSPGIWMLKGDRHSYNTAHRLATIAEMHAVADAFGKDAWQAYDKPLEPYVKPDDPKVIAHPPADILREPMTTNA